ncbi:hypothetical protein Esti_002228 [Eimeria stiedai]
MRGGWRGENKQETVEREGETAAQTRRLLGTQAKEEGVVVLTSIAGVQDTHRASTLETHMRLGSGGSSKPLLGYATAGGQREESSSELLLLGSLLSPPPMTAALLPPRAAVSPSVSPAAVSFDAAARAAATPAVSSAEALNERKRQASLSRGSPLCSKHCRNSPVLLSPRSLAEGEEREPLHQQGKRGPPPLVPPFAAEEPLQSQRGAPQKQREARNGDSPVAVGVYLAGYLLASPLLSLCNKRLYGGPAKNLGLTCCLLQQLILCCCLLLCKSQPQQPLTPQLQQLQEEQEQQQKWGDRRQETGTVLVSVSFRQQLQLACPYVLMLWSSNACLAVSSLASYQIARCSSIPIALLLEVLAVSSHEASPSAAAAEGGAALLLQRMGKTLRALRTRAVAVGGLRTFSALAVAAGLAAAAADGDSLQPHAALLGVAASAAGAVYLQLASSCFRIRPQAPAAAAARPTAAAAVSAASAAKAAALEDPRPAAGGDERGRQEIAVAQRVALLSILLLLPVLVLSQEPQQLMLRLQQQQQHEESVSPSDLLLLVVSGCLAGLLPLCTYGCLRGLSPLACCVAGFTKMAAQMLLSPWLAQEALSVSTAAGCCCCLVGSLAFCLSSHKRQSGKQRDEQR